MIWFASWWFLLFIPFILFIFFFTARKNGLKFSSVKILQQNKSKKTVKHLIGKSFFCCGIILSLAALARPQTAQKTDNLRLQGIDIAMILDVSGTMQSVDFSPNRLEAARKTIDEFITARTSDRISLIIFAGTAYTRIPLTLDHEVVRESLASVTFDSVNQDGTAIGMAISTGINRLRKSSAASKIIILVTDGDNNAGDIDPGTASRLAAESGIKIYTIGIGSDRLVLPVRGPFGQTQYRQYEGGFDEALLKRIAETTGGRYFRAADSGSLKQVFETINQLEKTEFENENFREYNELAFAFIKAALIFMLIGIFLDKFYFIQIP